VRFAEEPRVGCDVHIEAEPSRVWGLVTDMGPPARLSPELQRVQWLDGAEGPAIGARFAGYNHHRLRPGRNCILSRAARSAAVSLRKAVTMKPRSVRARVSI